MMRVSTLFALPGGLRRWRFNTAALLLALSACGGGGGGGGGSSVTIQPIVPATGPNVQPLVVNAGPTGNSVNTLFTSVTICMPGSTSACQVIDHVLVDTGSTGLRLLADVLTLPLPRVTVNSNQSLLNCAQFVDATYLWGPVVTGDLLMSGEKAANLTLQVAGDRTSPAVPTACSSGNTSRNSVSALGAKGILGIGNRLQDCGTFCANRVVNGFYYSYNGSTTADTAVSTVQQVKQPIALFASNNNGSIISLPAVPDPGADVVTGALIFGIGTQPNNSQVPANLLALNSSGYFTTTFKGRTLANGFIDSGSNGLFFGTADFRVCATSQWYCPPATTALQATNTGTNTSPSLVNFAVSNADALFANNSFTAFSTLAAPAGDNVSFDFGLPFFYGRNVATAIEGKRTPSAVGPYIAY